ncbi:uncharacterized protein LOC125216895 [Salvia hispanica]|uniref:uncharacterized protein LOC125197830 n=1 Tax=Salvia hispanica TaxID=49212 RepID=UPI002008F86E|nr:uncharacterized protein LOC125197830 [Salvia hispanica]XP_047974639.1 uncharacterized protein LOC125216895 [Salvia hispanica]
MCFLGCDKVETEVARQQAPGFCPYCGGKVQAFDLISRCRFCFLPIGFRFKRKYFCSLCSRRLVLYHF